MHIQRLRLTQFRNYSSLDLTFSKGINCLTGKNGAGKTNVLDALHYLAFAKGFRTSQDKQAVQDKEDFFMIEGMLHKDERTEHIACNYIKGKGKKVLIDQRPLEKLSEHIGKVPLVAVLPYDTELINGAAALRRRFMDMLISQYSLSYLKSLIQYEKALRQRNALLKQFYEKRYFDRDLLELWNDQLIPAGITIFRERQQFVEEYLPVFQHWFHQIVSEHEQPQIQYRSVFQSGSESEWKALLKEQEEKDMVLQYTSAGVHRDNLVFSINKSSVRNFGSQGQQKTFIIALKLAQYQMLGKIRKMSPILLLDDIFDKLDEFRLARIAALLDEETEGQVFITDTSRERLEGIFQSPLQRKLQFFAVEDGKVS